MNNKIYTKVFLWLFVGLLITFSVGFATKLYLLKNLDLALKIFSGSGLWIIIIVQLVLAVVLGIGFKKFNSTITTLFYILYTALTGVTFSTIFIYFKMDSIIIIFLITSLLFGVFAVIGSRLKVDLTKFGTYLFIALIGIVVTSIINIFIGSTTLTMIVSAVAILIFTLYIGYDIKKIQELANSDIDENKIAVYGAFQLYLDFINIFIRLLELFGDAND